MDSVNVAPHIREYYGKRVHMIGIGGSSMSGLARVLQTKGCRVSGSDMAEGENLRVLRERGIPVAVGHSAEYLTDAELAIYSAAIAPDNAEFVECIRSGIPVMERSVLLGQLSEEYETVIAVCGTHGKTTSTSMLAEILVDAGADPTIHIGGVLESIGGSVRQGNSGYFLTEACEYRRSFLTLLPAVVVLLNIDEDHLDYYRDIDEIESAFGELLGKLPADGWALGNGDDPRARRQLELLSCKRETFGVSENADYRMVGICEDSFGFVRFSLYHRQELLGEVSMGVPGLFNAKNAAAALAVAHHMGIDMASACGSIERFRGVHRRFELTGTLYGAELFHDYGHNPAEIKNALSIARRRCRKGRLWAVVQPHTYSRVKTLFQDYLMCTEAADITLVTDIFAAREQDPGDISSEMLAEGMRACGLNVRWTPTFADAAAVIRDGVCAGDLVITLGCGDIYRLNELLLRTEQGGRWALEKSMDEL